MPTYHHLPNMGKAGPYSHAVEANGFVFCSGIIPLNFDTDTPDTATIEAATHRVFHNLKQVLAHIGLGLQDVVKATVFLASMDDYAAVNQVYAAYFGEAKPARSAVAVKTLPLNMPVEIEVIAVRPSAH